MSYSTLKKALQLFDEPVFNKKTIGIKKKGLVYFNPFFYLKNIFEHISITDKGHPNCLNKAKNNSRRARSVFKVPNFIKSDAGKSIEKIKEQIRNEKELNLVQLNLERLHKLDKTSCVNNIASNLVCIKLRVR